MIEVPQNRDVLSQVAPDFLPNFQSGGAELNIETTPAPREEHYFLESPKSRSSELFMTLHIVRDFLKPVS